MFQKNNKIVLNPQLQFKLNDTLLNIFTKIIKKQKPLNVFMKLCRGQFLSVKIKFPSIHTTKGSKKKA